jgi:dUTP pyrophosphatase
MRKFEKISFNQFQKDTNLTETEYEQLELPERSTRNSAGYDFYLLTDFTLLPNEIKTIPTGIKAQMNNDEVLLIIIRSSLGTKYNIRLVNQIGIIDSDYYNNESNEGHIFIKVQNEGTKILNLAKGDRIVQGIFTKYLITENEQNIQTKRTGGFGSTNKEE